MSIVAALDKVLFFNASSKYSVLRMKTEDSSVPAEARSPYRYHDHLIRFTAVGIELPQTDTITQRNAVVEQHLWCIDTVMTQYAAWMQTAPIDPDDVYQSLAVRLIRAVNSYDPCKGYLKEYILSQLKREMVRVRSTQTVYGLTQAPANIGSTIVPLTIAAQRESYWETYIAV